MKSDAFFYCFKIWITALCMGPIVHDLLPILGINLSKTLSGASSAAFLFLTPAFACISLPSLLLAWVSLMFINNYGLPIKVLKVWLTLIALLLSELPAVLVAVYEHESLLKLAYALVPYQIVMVVCIWLYKLGERYKFTDVEPLNK